MVLMELDLKNTPTCVVNLKISWHEPFETQKKDKDRRKGKGRRFCLGVRFIKFLAALAVLHKHDSKNRMNCTRMICFVLGKIDRAARNLINLPPKQQRRPSPFLLYYYLSFFYALKPQPQPQQVSLTFLWLRHFNLRMYTVQYILMLKWCIPHSLFECAF